MNRFLLAFVFAAQSAAPQRPVFIQNASVIDGTGSPARVTNVRIAAGKVAAVGGSQQPNDSVIDATGLVLAPGFIDSHSHHHRGLFQNRDALAAVSQGITTIVVGQDGGGLDGGKGSVDRDPREGVQHTPAIACQA